jgi:small subunit ribosomal protein S4
LARYVDSACKLCRREGEKLFLKGDRCFSQKCAFERRAYPPGIHGRQGQFRRKESDYGLQLREKQKVRRLYGVFERQFRRYFRQAQRQKGLTGVNLLIILESRLDNVLYRLGIAASRAQARQLISHGHFEVNGRKTNISSFLVNEGDRITIHDQSKKNSKLFSIIKDNINEARIPEWLSLDVEQLSGRVLTMPSRDQIDITLNEQLIVEYYSR